MKSRLLHIALALLLVSLTARANKYTDSVYKVADKCFQNGDYARMLDLAVKALRVMEKTGSCGERSYAIMKAGRAYYFLQEKLTCIKYMRDAWKLADECKVDSIRWMCARQIGAVYYEFGKIDSALIYLHEADRLLKNSNDWAELSSLYSIMGETYHRGKKDKQKGWYYFNLAEEYAIRSGNKNRLAFAYIKKGIYSTTEKDCKTGEAYFRKAWALYKELHLVEGEMYAMHCIGLAMSDCGNAKGTFEILSQRNYIRDSIFKQETADKTAEYRTLYETEKKERENLELSRLNAIKQLEIANEIKSKRIIITLAIIALSLITIVFLFLYNRYKLKKQAELNEQLTLQQQLRFQSVIEAEENERKRIASDLHDGVGQLMSAVKINMNVLQGEMHFENTAQQNAYEKIVTMVDESCKEVRAVSHNMMPNALLKTGLASAVRTFINQIDGKAIRIELYTEGLNERIDSNIEVILYRVVQECVNNVIKHARASRLDIALIKDADGIAATIEDNGAGFDATEKAKFEGIGLKNIISRIDYLKGTVEWNSAPGKGTLVAIHIPLANA